MVLACEAIKLARLETMFQRNWLPLSSPPSPQQIEHFNKMFEDIYSSFLLYQISHYIQFFPPKMQLSYPAVNQSSWPQVGKWQSI